MAPFAAARPQSLFCKAAFRECRRRRAAATSDIDSAFSALVEETIAAEEEALEEALATEGEESAKTKALLQARIRTLGIKCPYGHRLQVSERRCGAHCAVTVCRRDLGCNVNVGCRKRACEASSPLCVACFDFGLQVAHEFDEDDSSPK